jgi:hypothetical protein
MINFASCLTIGKALGWGTLAKCEARLGYCLDLAIASTYALYFEAIGLPRPEFHPNYCLL